ncbi:MAG TPA: NADPH-dependent 7-cyano-7-deazaguanine reductase QueF [Burkholderiaceae bacterium]|nr:NADPH-dependent 7-cyano-7-deazaguanine reductase QueF [Burkholderiaceae bacterium]
MSESLHNAPLGRDVGYPDRYDPGLLFAISRQDNRAALTLPDTWHGADIWNAYEISWLNLRGKPVVATGCFRIPHDSPRLIESKSFKLYLNSWNQEKVADVRSIEERMTADLSQAAGAPVTVQLATPDQTGTVVCRPMEGENIDDMDIDIRHYQPEPGLLRCDTDAGIVSETLVSDLLKSNCPVTGQPDWASVQVRYTGHPIDRASLLAYIVSLRQHTEFHEHCIEKMYCDIRKACAPDRLFVYARYTRRGGLDINPWRSSHPVTVKNVRTPRQ